MSRMRLQIGVVTLVVLAAIGVYLARKPLRQRFSSTVETREGILTLLVVPAESNNEGPRPRAVKPGEYCILVHGYTRSGPTELDQLEDRFWGSDGLDRDFCADNPELINHRIQVRGVRAAGEAIDQDCNNRSCFDATLLSR